MLIAVTQVGQSEFPRVCLLVYIFYLLSTFWQCLLDFVFHITCVLYNFLGRLPDVSDDTPETNPLLRYHDMPDFNIPPDKVITGTAKLSQDYEVALLQHLKHLQGSLQIILLWNSNCILSKCRCGLK